MALSEVFKTPYLTTLSLLLITALLLLVSLVQIYRAWYRLRHIPGPCWASFSKGWMLRNTLGGSMHLALKQVCDEFGKPPLPSPEFATPSYFPSRRACRDVNLSSPSLLAVSLAMPFCSRAGRVHRHH